MKIIWSDNAIADYHQNIGYLLNQWSAEIAEGFINDVEEVLGLILVYPQLYPTSEIKDIRKAVIRKQITLFYKIEGDDIFLVRFWNNHQDPKNLTL